MPEKLPDFTGGTGEIGNNVDENVRELVTTYYKFKRGLKGYAQRSNHQVDPEDAIWLLNKEVKTKQDFSLNKM